MTVEKQKVEREHTGQQVVGASPYGMWRLTPAWTDFLPPWKVREMRKQPTLGYAMVMITVAGDTSEWAVESDVDVPPSVTRLIQQFIDENKSDLWSSCIRGWFEFGYACYEKIFEEIEDETGMPLIHLRKCKELLQERTTIEMNGNYGFFGLRNTLPTDVFIPAWKALVLTHQQRGDNLLGRSIFCDAEHAYDMLKKTLENMVAFEDARSGPRYIIHYPPGYSYYNGEELPNEQVALKMLDEFKNKNVLAFQRRDNSGEGATTTAADSDWDVTILNPQAISGELIQQARYYDELQVRSTGLPERAVLQGEFGTKADAANGTEYAVRRVEYLVNMCVDQLNRYCVDKLIEMNFGRKMVGKVRIKAGPINQRNVSEMCSLLTTLMGTDYGQTFITQMLDMDAILDQSGWPHKNDDSLTKIPLSDESNDKENPNMKTNVEEHDINEAPPNATSVLRSDFDRRGE